MRNFTVIGMPERSAARTAASRPALSLSGATSTRRSSPAASSHAAGRRPQRCAVGSEVEAEVEESEAQAEIELYRGIVAIYKALGGAPLPAASMALAEAPR